MNCLEATPPALGCMRFLDECIEPFTRLARGCEYFDGWHCQRHSDRKTQAYEMHIARAKKLHVAQNKGCA